MAIIKQSDTIKGYWLELHYDERNISIEQNSSRVYFKLFLCSDANHSFYGYTCNANVNVGGKVSNYNASTSIAKSNKKLLIDDYFTFNHDGDGTKTVTIKGSFQGSGGYSPGSIETGNYSFTLATIPRASKLTTTLKSSYRTDEPIQVSCIKYYDQFKIYWNMQYFHDNQWKSLNWDKTDTTATLDQHINNKVQLAQLFPNSRTVKMRLNLSTYQKDGKTKVGGYSYYFDLYFDDSFKPSLTLSHLEKFEPARVLNLGYYVKSKSLVSLTANATLKYNSPIVKYAWSVASENAKTVLFYPNKKETKHITCTITDGRGKQATASTDIRVEDYEPPKIEILNIEQQATQIIINYKYRITSLSNKNKKELKLQYKKVSEETKAEKVIGTSQYEIAKSSYALALNMNDSWFVNLIIKDSFGGTQTNPFYISTKIGLEMVKNYDASVYGVGIATNAKIGQVRSALPIFDDRSSGKYLHTRSDEIKKYENGTDFSTITSDLKTFIDAHADVFMVGTIKSFMVSGLGRPFQDPAWDYAVGMCIRRSANDIQLIVFSPTNASVATCRKWGSGSGSWDEWKWIQTYQQKIITNTTDFNNLNIQGRYVFQANDVVARSSNRPVGIAGWLDVRTTKNDTSVAVWWYVLQEYRTLFGDLYIRRGESGNSKNISWGSWSKKY